MIRPPVLLTLPLLGALLFAAPALAAAPIAAPAAPAAAAPEGGEKAAPPPPKVKEKRRFLIDGKLRFLKVGEVRPYVPPALEADPVPDPSPVQAVEVLEDEAQVLARPYYGAPMIGTLALGARLPVRGVTQGRGGHYCPDRRWVALAPTGWICAKQAHPTKQPLTTDSVLRVPEGERLPFHYVMVSSKDPLPLWASVDDLKDAKEPERTLARGDSVAIAKIHKWEGDTYYISAEGKVLPVKGTYAMGPPSAWVGVVLDPKVTTLPFGWITPDKVKIFDSAEAGRRIVDSWPRRTRVSVLEETTVSGKRYLRLRRSDAPAPAPPPPPPPSAAPTPTPEEPARWALASDVNEVRVRPTPEGANPGGRWIDVDLGEQVLVAYEGERPVYATLVSSGRAVPTPMGNYPMWAKVSAITMKSQPYDDHMYFVNKVPWALFFQAHNAIHGAYWHDRFGTTKSHGCVNVSPLDARHLFEWMVPALPPGWSSIRPLDLRESVTVHIYNSQLKKPFRQDRPIGPPDKDDEADRLEAAEKRRAETAASEAAAAAAAATPPPAAGAAPVNGVH